MIRSLVLDLEYDIRRKPYSQLLQKLSMIRPSSLSSKPSSLVASSAPILLARPQHSPSPMDEARLPSYLSRGRSSSHDFSGGKAASVMRDLDAHLATPRSTGCIANGSSVRNPTSTKQRLGTYQICFVKRTLISPVSRVNTRRLLPLRVRYLAAHFAHGWQSIASWSWRRQSFDLAYGQTLVRNRYDAVWWQE